METPRNENQRETNQRDSERETFDPNRDAANQRHANERALREQETTQRHSGQQTTNQWNANQETTNERDGLSEVDKGRNREENDFTGNDNAHKQAPFRGDWNRVRNEMKNRYSHLTDDDLNYTEGREHELFGRLRPKLGKSDDEVRREINDFL